MVQSEVARFGRASATNALYPRWVRLKDVRFRHTPLEGPKPAEKAPHGRSRTRPGINVPGRGPVANLPIRRDPTIAPTPGQICKKCSLISSGGAETEVDVPLRRRAPVPARRADERR